MITDPDRPYLKDDLDWVTLDYYVELRGMHPPMRPDGFLDEHERRVWQDWREAAKQR